jgi:hypothetical protein
MLSNSAQSVAPQIKSAAAETDHVCPLPGIPCLATLVLSSGTSPCVLMLTRMGSCRQAALHGLRPTSHTPILSAGMR